MDSLSTMKCRPGRRTFLKSAGAGVQFARSGDPNHNALPNWPAYTTAERATMVFDNVCKTVNDPGSEERRLWASL